MFKIVKCEEGKKYCAKPLHEAEIYDIIGTYEDEAFILPEDVIAVDIDDIDPDIIDAIIDEFGIKTMYSHTDEGAHLFFKKPARYKYANSGVCPLGIRIEHKHKQSVITYQGITRTIHNEGELEQLPYIFTIDDRFPDVYGLEDNDGRYDKMLTMNGLIGKRSNKRQILQFVNTYILAEPIKGAKLNGIINSELDDLPDNDEDTIKSKQEKKKDLIDELLEKFKPVRFNGALYFWDFENDSWETDPFIMTRLLYKQFYGFGASTIDEYKKHIENLAEIIRGYKIFPIQFKNGYLYDGEWFHGVYEEFTPFMLDYTYLPNAPITTEMETFMNFITDGDQTLIKYLFEAFSQTFEVDPNKRNKFPRVHTFLGDGGNGKGMLMRLLKTAVGRQNSSSVNLHKFNDKDELNTLRGKLLNISEDENGTVLKDTMLAKIKNVAAADEITTRMIYEKADSNVLIFPALFVTSNHAFPTFEKGESVKRRFFWISFNQELKSQPWLNDKFVEQLYSEKSMEWFVSQMVKGYFDVREKGFTQCEVIDKFTEEYHSTNNNIEEYLKFKVLQDFDGKKISDCYSAYEQWAESEKLYPMKSGDFKLAVSKVFNLRETVAKEKVDATDVNGNAYITRVSVKVFKGR